MSKEKDIEILEKIVQTGGNCGYVLISECPIAQKYGKCLCNNNGDSEGYATELLKELKRETIGELKDGFYTDENILVEVSDDKDFEESYVGYLAVYNHRGCDCCSVWDSGVTAEAANYNLFYTTLYKYCRLYKPEKKYYLMTEEGDNQSKVELTAEQKRILGIK